MKCNNCKNKIFIDQTNKTHIGVHSSLLEYQCTCGHTTKIFIMKNEPAIRLIKVKVAVKSGHFQYHFQCMRCKIHFYIFSSQLYWLEKLKDQMCWKCLHQMCDLLEIKRAHGSLEGLINYQGW